MKKLTDIFKKKPKEELVSLINPYTHQQITFMKYPYVDRTEYLVYPLESWQIDFAESEANRINNALKANKYTECFEIIFQELEYADYSFNPYTPKGKIKTNPCRLNLYFRKNGVIPYEISIEYDINDIPKTASYSISYTFPDGDSYSINLHCVNNTFYVTKVIMTDKHLDNHKLFHIKKEDI